MPQKYFCSNINFLRSALFIRNIYNPNEFLRSDNRIRLLYATFNEQLPSRCDAFLNFDDGRHTFNKVGEMLIYPKHRRSCKLDKIHTHTHTRRSNEIKRCLSYIENTQSIHPVCSFIGTRYPVAYVRCTILESDYHSHTSPQRMKVYGNEGEMNIFLTQSHVHMQ